MKIIGWAFLLLIWTFVGCTTKTPYTYTVAVAEEKVVSHCMYIDTISENTDMGAFQIHPNFCFDVRDKVLKKAEMLGATHVVWLADYTFGASAMVYYCGNQQ